MRVALYATLALLLTGCAAGMVRSNDGQRVVIEHNGWVKVDEVRPIAAASCRQAGKAAAVHVTSVSTNPALPLGTGAVMSTFRCE